MPGEKKPPPKKYRCPWWIFKLSHRVIPGSVRELYAYLCIFGQTGNWQWDCRLAKKYGVTDRTIRRWLHWLKANKLIWIENPFGRSRRIHAIYYADSVKWLDGQLFKKATIKTHPSSKEFEDSRRRNMRAILPAQGRTKMSAKKL